MRQWINDAGVDPAAVVLFIGYRKEGDKHDAYVEFERHLKRGAFDQQFAELGLPKPKP
jgi:hypothetical protein